MLPCQTGVGKHRKPNVKVLSYICTYSVSERKEILTSVSYDLDKIGI